MTPTEKRQLRNVFVFWAVVFILLAAVLFVAVTTPQQQSPYIGH
jgi:hypothetical protein